MSDMAETQLAVEERWEPEWLDPKTLKAHPENYLEHGPEQIEEIKQSIREHGVYKTITISRDGYVLAGHGVTQAVIELGLPGIPCRRIPAARDRN